VPLTGWLGHAAALAALGEATVLLHFSAWDGAPLAVLEAMARDVVVVASDIPANRELLGDAQVCVDEQDAIGLIRAVLRDDALREKLLASQRERAAGRGAALMARRQAEVYAAVLSARREPARRLGSRAAAATRNIGAPWS
jgi:glycosyltransferase involved in cell wall biosynthesis